MMHASLHLSCIVREESRLLWVHGSLLFLAFLKRAFIYGIQAADANYKDPS